MFYLYNNQSTGNNILSGMQAYIFTYSRIVWILFEKNVYFSIPLEFLAGENTVKVLYVRLKDENKSLSRGT